MSDPAVEQQVFSIPLFVNEVDSNSGATQVQTFAATLPGSRVIGNTLILAAIFFVSGGGPFPTIASGWTTLYTSTGFTLGGYTKLTVFSRLIDGTEGATVIVGNSGSATGFYAVGAAQYAGVASPAMDGTAQAGGITVGTTTASPAITTTVANDMVLCFCGGGEGGYTLDTPGNVQRMNSINVNVQFAITMCEVPKAAAGTLAAGTWTRASGNQAFLGQTLALLAGAVAPPPGGRQQYKNPQAAGVAMSTMQRASHMSLANGVPVGGAGEGSLTTTGFPAGVLGTGDNPDLWTPPAESA